MGHQIQDVDRLRPLAQGLDQSLDGERLVLAKHRNADPGQRLSRPRDLAGQVHRGESVIGDIRGCGHGDQRAQRGLGTQAHRAPVLAQHEAGEQHPLGGGER